MEATKVLLINVHPTRESITPDIDQRIIDYHQVKESVGTEKGDQRHEPNNGLLHIGAVLLKEKYDVEYLDLNAREANYFKKFKEYFTNEQVDEILQKKIVGVNFVLVSCLTPSFQNAVKIIDRVKSINPNCKVILGGVFPTLNPEYCVKACRNIDVLVIGEGEIVVPKIICAYKNDDFSELSAEKGLIFKISGTDEYKILKGQNVINDLNTLPIPAYELLQEESKPYVYRVFTARGCRSACSFCAPSFVSGHRLRNISPEKVIKTLLKLKNELKADSFLIGDLTFLDDQRHGMMILRRVIKEKINLPFWCQTRLDRINQENIDLLAEAGCKQIAIGIESYNDSILSQINKGISVDKMVKALLMAKKKGIQVQAYFIVGLPHESRESIERTIRFVEYSIKRGYLDLTHISIYTPYPGLPLPNNVHIIDQNFSHYHQGVFMDMPPVPVYKTEMLNSSTTLELFLKLLKKTTVAFKSKPDLEEKFAANLQFDKETILGTEALTIAGEIEEYAKHNPKKRSVFNIVQGIRDSRNAFVSKVMHEDDNYIIGDTEIYTTGELLSILKTVDGLVDYILLDADIKTPLSREIIQTTYDNVNESKIYAYSDMAIWCLAAFLHIQHEIDHIETATICLSPINKFSKYLGGMLENRGANVLYYNGNNTKGNNDENVVDLSFDYQIIDLIVNFSFGEEAINQELICKLPNDTIIIDATTEGFSAGLYNYLHRNIIKILKPEMRPLLSTQMLLLEKFEDHISTTMGSLVSGGYRFISGGIVGRHGDIVVDSVRTPKRIIGMADGKGKLVRPSELTQKDIIKMQKAESILRNNGVETYENL